MYTAFSGAPAGRPSTLLDGLPVSRQPWIRRALAVGSLALLNELERPSSDGRDAARAQAKLLRYLIRMSNRPTPYGLFAGVALGQWAECTDLALADAPRPCTRPDMGWLYSIVTTLEAREEVRRHLRFIANPTALIRAGRIFLAQRAPSGEYSPPEVSVRATGAAQRALAAARRPTPYVDLMQHLLETTPGATREKVEKLLTELWQQTLLLTDLRPPMTCASPAQYVADRLADIPAAQAMREQLVGVLQAAAAWDEDTGGAESAAAYRSLVEQARRVSQAETPLQVDMALALAGCGLNRQVAEEAVRAAELLLRLSSWPQGIPSLDAYRRAFESRYGFEREVPLVELLDPQFGLGPLSNYGGAVSGISQQKQAQRTQALLDLAQQALRDHQLVVELDADTLARLETWSPSASSPQASSSPAATAPLSLDLSIFVAARSADALDRGEFQIVVGPNLGGLAAGRNLGRFADMLAPEGPAALERIAQAEQATAPDRLWAELVYMPQHFHSANVVIRPPVRRYEIDLAVSSGVDPEQTIPLNELVVGLAGGAAGSASRFYVRWPALNAEVQACSGHMLNPMQAPPACRFLTDVSRDGQAQFSGFDWGPAYGFPFLPRVQVGRIVLRPAEWRITAEMSARELPADSAGAFREALAAWRERWWAPRHLYLSLGDNRLLLDLENPVQADQLREELKGLKEGGAVTLQEVIPAVDENWLPGPDGHYAAEFVVSLVRKASSAAEPARASGGSAAVETAGPPSPPVQAGSAAGPQRLRPPGSEWLFLKLYAPRTWEDDLIASFLYPFAEQSCAAGEADSWFFIRYSDPDPHLRLRFHGAPERLMGQLFHARLRLGRRAHDRRRLPALHVRYL